MLKIALAIFLIAHGLVHAGLVAAPTPMIQMQNLVRFSLHQSEAGCCFG